MEKTTKKKKQHCKKHLYDHLNCAGWYGILYKPDDKFHYIGCSTNIKRRWSQHRCNTTAKEYNDEFHKDLRANQDNYECIVLMEYDGVIKDRHELYEKLVPTECFLIEHFKLLGHPIVTSSENNSHHYSNETKAKISAKMTGENNPNFRKHFSNETKKKISASQQNKVRITNGIDEHFISRSDYEANYDHTIWKLGGKSRKKRA